MAGLYITFGNSNSQRIQQAAQRLTCLANESVETIVQDDLAIAWVSHDSPKFFAPAYDPGTGVRVITAGRVAWTQTEWNRAKSLKQYQGGLSCRLLLDRYLENGISAIERHNGSAIVVIWDPRDRSLHVLTDHFGFYPLFTYSSNCIKSCVISTFPDAIAEDPDVRVTTDYVSMAEFLREWKITPPHTYYSEIKYAGAATHHTWNLASATYHQRLYWQPFQDDFYPNLKTAIDELTAAVQHAIQIRTLPHLGPITTYISGGMDSRVIPFAAHDASIMYGVNLYDVPNREVAIAQQICTAAGIPYIGYQREADYYPKWMRQGVEISGAMWSAEDNHFLGNLSTLQQLQTQTVLAAFPVDDLFKGSYLEQRYVRLLGRNLPFFQFEHTPVKGFLMEDAPRPAPPEFAQAMNLRLDEWFGDLPKKLVTDRDRLLLEDRRVRPACYLAASSDPMMFRITPYDIFLGDRAIADCYSRMRPQWKINATVWHQVVARLCGTEIVDATRNWRPGASNTEKLAVFARDWLKRRQQTSPSDKLETEGSWSNLGWYARHSQRVREIWESVSPYDRELITILWGSDPWEIPLEDWATPAKLTAKGLVHQHSPYGLFRILTLLNRWSIQREIKQKTIAVIS
jgi:hypothetical protein